MVCVLVRFHSKVPTFQRNRYHQLQVTVNMKENISPNVTTHLTSFESSQKTAILVGPPRKTSCHERIKSFLAQGKDCDSTADITTCFAAITKRLKNHNKHLKCLPGCSVDIGTGYGPEGPDRPGNRIPVEGETLRTLY